jgi:uncharacterized protein
MRAFFAAFLLTLGLAAPVAALEVPARPQSGLADPDHVLLPQEARRIEDQLEAYAQGTTARYAVAIFRSLDGENTQDFGMKMFEAWKLGGAANNDGVLIAIYEREHKIRFDVGYGLEDKLPDIICRRIIDEQMSPRFREGDKVGGILAALHEVDHRVTGRGEALPVARGAHKKESLGPLLVLLIVILLLFLISRSSRRRRGGGWPGFWWWGGGGGFGGGGWGGGGGGGGGGWGGGGGGSAGGGGADGGW